MSETYVKDRSASKNLGNDIHTKPEPYYQEQKKEEVDPKVEELFPEKPWIVNAFWTAGIFYVSQIPKEYDELLKIKGIGKKSAIKIMEVL